MFDSSIEIPISMYDPDVTTLKEAILQYTVTSRYGAADVRFNVEGVDVAREDWGVFDFPFIATRTGTIDITGYVLDKKEIQLGVFAHDFRFDINLPTEFPLDLKVIIEYEGEVPPLEPGEPEGSGHPEEFPWETVKWMAIGITGAVGLVAVASIFKSLKR